MSKTEEIDKTIESLNAELAKPKLSLKNRLAITDRLTRLYSLKLKHSDDGKGGKFALPSPSTGADHANGNSRQ
jgi:hypothetical protein